MKVFETLLIADYKVNRKKEKILPVIGSAFLKFAIVNKNNKNRYITLEYYKGV